MQAPSPKLWPVLGGSPRVPCPFCPVAHRPGSPLNSANSDFDKSVVLLQSGARRRVSHKNRGRTPGEARQAWRLQDQDRRSQERSGGHMQRQGRTSEATPAKPLSAVLRPPPAKLRGPFSESLLRSPAGPPPKRFTEAPRALLRGTFPKLCGHIFCSPAAPSVQHLCAAEHTVKKSPFGRRYGPGPEGSRIIKGFFRIGLIHATPCMPARSWLVQRSGPWVVVLPRYTNIM